MLSDSHTGLELSTQIVIAEALRRSIDVEVLDAKDNFIRLRKGERTEYVKQATKTSLDSYIAPLIMENKEVTKLILREHGIRVPDGISVGSVQEGMAEWARFAEKDMVAKPKSTNFGIGVSILKVGHSADAYRRALELAFEHDDAVMLEEFAPGREYRFLVVGDEAAAVLYRVPANVRGDGERSITELVREKNLDPLRGVGYVTPLEKIKLGEVEQQYLLIQGKDFHTVPAMDEVVYLRENSNISTGGDSIDCTDEMAEGYKHIAVRAAQAVGARICGVDMIVPDLRAEPGTGSYSIIELNFNPALHIHTFPYQGVNRQVAGKLLDLLGFESTLS